MYNIFETWKNTLNLCNNIKMNIEKPIVTNEKNIAKFSNVTR